MANQSLSAKSVSVMPILLLGFIHVIVTPLREIFSVEPLLMVPYYLFGLLVGIFIHRKSVTVKDFEYRRSKVMKKMKSVYAAEEAGVWQSNVAIPTELSKESDLSAEVSAISLEAPELELGDEQKVEVSMLNEAKTVVEATRRMSGQSNFDDDEVISTIGANRRASPMDRLLDFIASLFNKQSAKGDRESRRIAALQAASQASPVKASRPQAPIQYERTEVKIGPDSNYIDNFNETKENEFDKNNDLPNQQKQTHSAFAPPNNQNNVAQSLESMAMLSTNNKKSFTKSSNTQSYVCKKCGYRFRAGDRFCDNCGSEL